MTREDEFIGAIVGLVLGLFGIAVLAELLKPQCPNCKARVDKTATICPNCGTWLGNRWQ